MKAVRHFEFCVCKICHDRVIPACMCNSCVTYLHIVYYVTAIAIAIMQGFRDI